MSPFVIEAGIPVPEHTGRGRDSRYPFHKMNIGDSFFVACEAGKLNKLRNALTSCRANAQKRTGYRFTSRTEGNGVRVWRYA